MVGRWWWRGGAATHWCCIKQLIRRPASSQWEVRDFLCFVPTANIHSRFPLGDLRLCSKPSMISSGNAKGQHCSLTKDTGDHRPWGFLVAKGQGCGRTVLCPHNKAVLLAGPVVYSDKQVVLDQPQRALQGEHCLTRRQEELLPSSAIKIVNFVAAVMCHLEVEAGYGGAAATGCLNPRHRPQVPGMIPNTSPSSPSQGDYTWQAGPPPAGPSSPPLPSRDPSTFQRLRL